jgi:two-component system phosphate regulon response regulator PhoB
LPPKRSILVIDDEKDILKLLLYNLEKEGYQPLSATTGEEGLELARARKPDLILLDLMLPGMDGLECCRLLRADKITRHIPILMLTAKNTEVDQVVGLEMGASDYVAKPFSVKVLLARVKNIFRSRDAKTESRAVLKAKDLVLDRERQSVTVKGAAVSLTKLEFSILGFLMENPGKVFSREQLLSGAWEGEAFVVDRTVDVHVKSIRQKLGACRDYIETVRGTGYRFIEFS